MAYASEVVGDAAAMLLSDEADIGLEANEFAQGTRILNDLMEYLFAGGVDVGYRPVSSSGDPVTIPAGALLPIKEQLAVQLAPMLSAVPNQELRLNARESLKGLKARYMRRINVGLPTGLPMGAGNNRGYQHIGSTFYPYEKPVAILRLASATNVNQPVLGTPTIISGWTVDSRANMTYDSTAATLTYDLYEPYLARIDVMLTMAATPNGNQVTFHLRKNGALLEGSALTVDSDALQNIDLTFHETIQKNDTLSLVVQNDEEAQFMTFNSGHFRVS